MSLIAEGQRDEKALGMKPGAFFDGRALLDRSKDLQEKSLFR